MAAEHPARPALPQTLRSLLKCLWGSAGPASTDIWIKAIQFPRQSEALHPLGSFLLGHRAWHPFLVPGLGPIQAEGSPSLYPPSWAYPDSESNPGSSSSSPLWCSLCLGDSTSQPVLGSSRTWCSQGLLLTTGLRSGLPTWACGAFYLSLQCQLCLANGFDPQPPVNIYPAVVFPLLFCW